MCQKKPGPRCTTHAYSDLKKAEVAVQKMRDQIANEAVPSKKDQVALERKLAILAKRDKEFSVAAIASEPTARAYLVQNNNHVIDPNDVKLVHARAVMDRVEQLKYSGTYDEMRREKYVRTQLARYLDDPSSGIRGHGGKTSPRLTRDVLVMLQQLPKSEHGRHLTPEEQETLARASKIADVSADYLPAEGTAVTAKSSVITTPLPGIEPDQPLTERRKDKVRPLPSVIQQPLPEVAHLYEQQGTASSKTSAPVITPRKKTAPVAAPTTRRPAAPSAVTPPPVIAPRAKATSAPAPLPRVIQQPLPEVAHLYEPRSQGSAPLQVKPEGRATRSAPPAERPLPPRPPRPAAQPVTTREGKRREGTRSWLARVLGIGTDGD